MDALLAVAVEEIALEGQEGCTVDALWNLLGARLPVGSITCLPPQLQDTLWGLLVRRTDDVQLYTLPPAGAENAPEDPIGTKNRGPRVKKKPDNNPMSKATLLDPSDPKVSTRAAAASNEVRLVASEAVRLSVLGVYEIQDSRFPLSDMQLAALAVVGRTRWRGTINADLANRLGIAYRNFYYIVKNLETRKLVVKNPVVFAPPGATVTVSSVLHLPRFQPAVKLGPGQMFKTVDAVRGMEVATYVLQDDNMYMRLVCSTIAETAERVVVESDLKLVCGFRGTRGHRLWRRLRRKMEEQGYLAFESCRVRDRLVPCVRLLKDWRPPAVGDGPEEGAGEEVEEADAEDVEAGGGHGSIHVNELSLERQLLEGVLSAGPDGVLNHELFSKLGISSKVYGVKLVDIIKRFNLQVTVVNRGRTVLNRIVAPPELLAAAGHIVPRPTAPAAPPAAAVAAAGAPDEAAAAATGTETPAADGTAAPAAAPVAAGDAGGQVAAAAAAPDAATTGASELAAAAAAPLDGLAGTARLATGQKKSSATAARTTIPKSAGKQSAGPSAAKTSSKGKGMAAAAAAAAETMPSGRPKRPAAVKASADAAAALKALGGDGGGDSDEEFNAEEEEERVVKAGGASSTDGGDEVEPESSSEAEASEVPSEELEEEQKQQRRGGGGAGRGRGRGRGRPAKRVRIEGTEGLAAAPPPGTAATPVGGHGAAAAAPVATTAAATAASGGAAAPAAAVVVPVVPVAVAAAAAGESKERKPHWTKVITLKTEDRLRLLVEHLNKHRFISRVQVRRLVMEWESAASGKPIPNSQAGPDIKTIRRLMDRLAQSGKAKLVRVETPGFLGDNRPIDTLIRPDLEATPELLDEIRKQMAEFERKLRSECCRKALAARKMATMIDYPVGNLLPETVVTAAAATGSATAAAVASGAGPAANGGGAAGGGGGPGAVDTLLDETTDGLLRAAGLHPADQASPPQTAGAAANAAGGGGGGGPAAAAPAANTPGKPLLSPEALAQLRIGRGVSLFRAVHNEATARSVENGLIPAKMVRVRLLHFLIAKLVGLGGFDPDPLASVDPDPGGMPNMPPSLGEEVLSLASATERSRMAFAFGAMKGGGPMGEHHQHQPRGPQQHQQDAGEGAAADGGEGTAAGPGGGAAAGQEAAGGGTAAMPMRHLSVRRLWSIMPLSVALQVLGSTSRRPPEELARLCESGATLGSLTPEQARNIMDGTSVHRLDYLISILRRLRLLEWAVVDPARLEATRRPGPGAGVRARDGQGVRLLVHGKGVLEVPLGKEMKAGPVPQHGTGAEAGAATGAAAGGTAGAAAGAAAGGQVAPGSVLVMAPSGFTALAGGSGRFVEVDLTTAAGLDEYWRRFEELYRLTGSSHAEVQRLRKCFPATTVPEVLSRNSWHGQRLMTAVQWLRLQSGLDQIDLADGSQITSLAVQLGIDVDVVARIVSDRRRRLNRLEDLDEGATGDEGAGGGRGVPVRLARLNPGAAVQGQAAAAGVGRSVLGGDEALPAGDRRRMMKRRTIRRFSPASRQRRKEEREAEAAARAARKEAQAAKRAEKEAAKALRRAARAAGTYVVRRRRREEIEADEAAAAAAGQPPRKKRHTGKDGGEGRDGATTDQEQKRRRRPPPTPALAAAQMAARDLSAVVPGRQALLLVPFVQTDTAAGLAAAVAGLAGAGVSADGRLGRDSDSDSEAGEGSDGGDGTDADGAAGPIARVPSSAAPTRVTRILWTASEDRVLLIEYVKLAADLGPHIRLPWKSRAGALPYATAFCIRHVRYLKRHYPSYTGRLDELLRRAADRRIDLVKLEEKAEARMLAYRERHKRRRAGQAVRPLGPDGLELSEEPSRPPPPQPPLPPPCRDPLEVTRQIVMGAGGDGEEGAEGAEAGPAAAPLPVDVVDAPKAGPAAAEELQHAPAPAPAGEVAPADIAAASAGQADPGPEAAAAAAAAAPPQPEPPLPEVPEDPEDLELLRRLAQEDQQLATAIKAEREALITEALSLVEDFVLVIPRRSSQKLRERLQQQGGLELGERLAPATTEAQMRRRAALAMRRSLGGALQTEGAADAAAGGGSAAAAAAPRSGSAALTNTQSAAVAAATAAALAARGRRLVAPAALPGATVAIGPAVLQRLAASQAAQLPRPSVTVTAAMSMLVSLLFQVRMIGGMAAWMSRQVVETLADFGRRFAGDVKTAALKQMQLRGWLASSGPRRHLELTQAFMNRLHGTDLPQGLLGRCAAAAPRLDALLDKAVAAGARRRGRREVDSDDADEEMEDAAAGPAESEADKATGAEVVERSCTLDVTRGFLVLDSQEQLPSEMVALALARQALGRVELLPGAVEMSPEWAGQAATAGMQATSVQLLMVPVTATAAPLPQLPPPAAGTRLVVTAGLYGRGTGLVGSAPVAAPAAPTSAQRSHPHSAAAAAVTTQPTSRHEHMTPSHSEQNPQTHRKGGLNPSLLAHGSASVTSSAGAGVGSAAGAGADGPSELPGELPGAVTPLFASSAVATEPATREMARAACRAYLAAEAPSCPAVVEELMEAVEVLLGASGPDGLTLPDLTAKLGQAAAPGGLTLNAPATAATSAATSAPEAAETADQVSADGCRADGDAAGPVAAAGSQSGDKAAARPEQPETRTLSLSLPPTQYHVSLVLRAVELHGLARRVGGWDETHFIAAEHCLETVVEVGAEAATDVDGGADTAKAADGEAATAGTAAAAPADTGADGAGPATATAEGPSHGGGGGGGGRPPMAATGRPVVTAAAVAAAAAGAARVRAAAAAAAARERVLRPWLDHRGCVNVKIWEALLQRLLGLVMRHPGIPEEILVASVDIIPPQACKELLHHLARHGRVEVRTMPPPPPSSRPRRPLLLLGGGGGAGGEAGAGAGTGSARPQGVPSVHYFPVLEQLAGDSLLKVPLP